MLVSVRTPVVHLDLPYEVFSKRLRGIQSTIKKAVPVVFLGSTPHSQTFAQMYTTITFRDEVKLQKHLNTCLRKVITRTLEHFLNIFEMFCRIFSSAPLSTVFHSAPMAKRCTSHVIITFGAKFHQHPVVLICKIVS